MPVRRSIALIVAVLVAVLVAVIAWHWHGRGGPRVQSDAHAELRDQAGRETSQPRRYPPPPLTRIGEPENRTQERSDNWLDNVGAAVLRLLSSPSHDASPRTVRGRVVTLDGRAAVGATVRAGTHTQSLTLGVVGFDSGPTAVVGETGRYEMRVASDELVVLAFDPDGMTSQAHVVPASNDNAVVDLVLAPGGGVRGVATYLGKPEVVDASLRSAGGARLAVELRTDKDGVYAFAQMPPGEYVLAVSRAQMFGGGAPRIVRNNVAISAAQVVTVDTTLPVGVSLVVLIEYSEGPDPDIVSYAFEREPVPSPVPKFGSLFGGADATNVMHYDDVEPGQYRLCVRLQWGGLDSVGDLRCQSVAVAATPALQEVTFDW